MKLHLDKIRIDGGTQPRVAIDQDIVADYVQALQDGAEFPPVVVFFDGVDYWLADGFHRYHSHRQGGVKEIAVDVRNGTRRDAILHSVGANAAHGLRRTNADKRKAVLTLLNDEEWGKWSNVQIAKQCGVSDMTVGRIREELSHQQSGSEPPSPRTYTTKHGTTAVMNTSNIGKSKPQPPEPDDVEEVEPEAMPEKPEAEPESKPQPERRGIGVQIAHEAINVLKRIPINDGLRSEGFRIVADWIETNK